MRILVTGSAGRVGRAIYIKLMRIHDVVGIDKTPCSTADYIGDILDSDLIDRALKNVDVIIHTAALHAPHVGLVPDSEFQSINVDATEKLALAGVQAGVKHFIFTSTTALYGYASTPKGIAGWVNEEVTPQPKSIYHKSKIAAEAKLEEISKLFWLLSSSDNGKLSEDEKIYNNEVEIGKVLINEEYPFALIKFLDKNFDKEQIFKSENGKFKIIVPEWLKI